MRRLLTILSVLLLVGSFGYKTVSKAAAADCDANNVIMCGGGTPELLQNGTNQPGTLQIFSAFNITSDDINSISSNSVNGVVTNDNNVWIRSDSGMCPDIAMNSLTARNRQAVQNHPNMCLVGTNAITAGRQNIAGSRVVTSDGVKFFERSPSVSFAQSSLPAYVVMKNGRFDFAIIKSCGNPVMATPVTTKTVAQPKKTTTVPTPTQTQTQTQTQTVNVTTPQVQAETTTPVVQPTVTRTLPNTGPGNILALAGTTSALGTLGHWYYSRRNRRF